MTRSAKIGIVQAAPAERQPPGFHRAVRNSFELVTCLLDPSGTATDSKGNPTGSVVV